MAEILSAGDVTNEAVQVIPPDVVQTALTDGFGWVMLYGAIAVWIFTIMSVWVFHMKDRHAIILKENGL